MVEKEKQKERVAIFIDRSNLYHSLDGAKIDFEKLIKELSKNKILTNAFYYITSLDVSSNEEKYWKHQKFLADLGKIPGFKVVLCTLRKSKDKQGKFNFEVKRDDFYLVGAYENLYNTATCVWSQRFSRKSLC